MFNLATMTLQEKIEHYSFYGTNLENLKDISMFPTRIHAYNVCQGKHPGFRKIELKDGVSSWVADAFQEWKKYMEEAEATGQVLWQLE